MLSVFLCFVFIVLANLIPETQGYGRSLRFTSTPNHGYRLNNHVIRTIDVINVDFCELQCYQEPNCVSYNFKKKDESNGKYKCDLNNVTYDHSEHSNDFEWNYDFVYRGAENSCSNNPCQNNATCQAGYTDKDYQCLCIPGFTGDNCEHDINECATQPSICDDNADCVNTHGSYECTCKDGFHGNGKNCIGCHDQDALGMESRVITDEQITASSEWNGNHAAILGRLHFQAVEGKNGAWSAGTMDVNQWLQIDLIGQFIVSRVATQGRNDLDQWVTEYKLQYSEDGNNFENYTEQGQTTDKIFTGNNDRDTVVYHDLNRPIIARYIRFVPVAWKSHISMRVEVFGCKQGCQDALGMQSGAITDEQITASSQKENDHEAPRSRLHLDDSDGLHSAWRALTDDVNQWLQIDLIGQYAHVTSVASQGSYNHAEWVTKYKLQYSDDGNNFENYTEQGQTTDKEFSGNTDQNTVVYHILNPPITARYIRFVPVTWKSHISMRVDLYGCTQVGWQSSLPGHSCKHIRDSGGSRGDGEYWIDPETNGNPLKVYCDMTTDGGGWLLVSNYVIDSPYSPPQLSVESSYRGISNYHNNKTFLTTSAMNELRTHLPFTQLRFYCSKQQGRTFHVTTATNSAGEAVVQYFSSPTDVMPNACGSFVRMEDDNSLLAGVCNEWGKEKDAYYVAKWGHQAVQGENRLYDHAAFKSLSYHWLLTTDNQRLECDDYDVGVSFSDFWKVFVR